MRDARQEVPHLNPHWQSLNFLTLDRQMRTRDHYYFAVASWCLQRDICCFMTSPTELLLWLTLVVIYNELSTIITINFQLKELLPCSLPSAKHDRLCLLQSETVYSCNITNKGCSLFLFPNMRSHMKMSIASF